MKIGIKMDGLKHLQIEFNGIANTLKNYEPDSVIINYLDNIKKGIEEKNLETIVYSLKKIDSWYDSNIKGICSNDYVTDKDAHKNSRNTIKEILDELNKLSQENISAKISKGYVLYSAFDEYKIIKQIGQGGNSLVYEAKDFDGKLVAVKIIYKNKTSKEKIKRFKNEINFCERAICDNIIEVIDHGIDIASDTIFYVMPLCQATLRDRINRGISPEDAIDIFYNLLSGLRYAHDRGITHRDIKPENILFSDESNSCKIADFGIAHFPKDKVLTSVETKTTSRMANFQYAAPEQRTKGKIVDAHADVYAMGLILNEMFTKELVQGENYKKIKECNPQYSFLDDIVEKMVQQQPEKRIYPISKIQSLLKVYEEENKNLLDIQKAKAKLTNLEVSSLEDIAQPKINDITFSNGVLMFEFDVDIPSKWIGILKSGQFSHIASGNYETYKFDSNGNFVYVLLNDMDNKIIIHDIVSYFKEWVTTVNVLYKDQIEQERLIAQNEEIEKIREEIQRKENENDINAFLQELI